MFFSGKPISPIFQSDGEIRFPDPEKLPVKSKSILRWSWYFLSPYKKTIIPFFIYRIIRTTWIGMFPFVFGYTVDLFGTGDIQTDPAFYYSLIFSYLFVFMVFLVTNPVFWFELDVFEKATRAITLFSINHINHLPLSWHEGEGSGGKLQRVMTARKSFAELWRIIRWTVFYLAGVFVGTLISVLLIDAAAYYALLFALMVTTYIGASWYFGRKVTVLYDRYNETFERLLSGVYEFVGSVRTVKSFHIQDFIKTKSTNLETKGQQSIMSVFLQIFLRWGIINFIAIFWTIIIVSLAYWATVDGNMTAGSFSTLVFMCLTLWGAMEQMAQVQDQIYEYQNGLQRLITTLKEKPASLDLDPVQNLPQDWQSLSFENLSYTYKDTDGQGVQDIDFTIKRGEKIAFVGESGAGKSTLVKILMKQMLPHHGGLYVDNINLKHISSAQWLNEIGFVPQDVELFNMTIRDNILIDRLNIDEAQYLKALDNAALRDFVESLPDGDQTMIGERGIKLSGGQRQRLGIARALVRQAEIIIFDEATSSLDSISERKIQDAMENSFAGHTVFLVAHRLSTVKHVDTILVLDQGRIVERGSFDDLITAKGIFAKLWGMQSNPREET